MSLAVFLRMQSHFTKEDRITSSTTYPGSFRVLFIENAKCLPSEVNSSGR